MKQMLDIYSDYLIASFSQPSATGLSSLVNGEISHDQVTRFLSQEKKTTKELWLIAKSFVKRFNLSKAFLSLMIPSKRSLRQMKMTSFAGIMTIANNNPSKASILCRVCIKTTLCHCRLVLK